jgi:hypothetical protein
LLKFLKAVELTSLISPVNSLTTLIVIVWFERPVTFLELRYQYSVK